MYLRKDIPYPVFSYSQNTCTLKTAVRTKNSYTLWPSLSNTMQICPRKSNQSSMRMQWLKRTHKQSKLYRFTASLWQQTGN